MKIGGEFKEMKMAAILVKVLLTLNGDEKNRANADLDLAFVKGMIIGLCSVKPIQNKEPIHKDLQIFMKGTA